MFLLARPALIAFARVAATTAFAVVTASAAHAQIYTSGLTTSAANPNIYFSTASGVSSYSSFVGATDELIFNPGANAGIYTFDYNWVFISMTTQFPPLPPVPPPSVFDAAFYSFGSSIEHGASKMGGAYAAQDRSLPTVLNTAQGWTYPGSGYIGLAASQIVGGSHTGYDYDGWAGVTLYTDGTATLNNFAMQSVLSADIAAGAAPLGTAPEPQAIVLVIIGISGAAARRLRHSI